jgi:hypothetical protein
MSALYDDECATRSLKELWNIYLKDREIEGELYYYALHDEARLDIVTPFMSEQDYKIVKESGFRSEMIELLDDLMRHRQQDGMLDCTGGHVLFSVESLTVTWLGSGKCRELIERRRGWST